LPDLNGLISLIEIDLQENNLSEFPYELAQLSTLEKIYLIDNPFVMTKKEREEMEKLAEELAKKGICLYF
jgi:Leucine-rich repeat (LRR) protein